MIVSLTTTPQRIDKIGPALASVIDQTVLPDKVILTVPEFDKDGVPFNIPKFIKYMPLVEVRRVANDVGPATKWFYTCQANDIAEDTPIIVLDDDQVYPKKLVEHYLNASMQFPGAAFTLLGWKVPKTFVHLDRECLASARIRLLGKDKLNRVAVKQERVDCVQGASSYMITKGMVTTDVSIFDEQEAARYADDMLISGLLAKKRIKVYVLPASFRFVRLHVWALRQAESLFKSVNKQSTYNDQLYRLFEKDWLK